MYITRKEFSDAPKWFYVTRLWWTYISKTLLILLRVIIGCLGITFRILKCPNVIILQRHRSAHLKYGAVIPNIDTRLLYSSEYTFVKRKYACNYLWARERWCDDWRSSCVPDIHPQLDPKHKRFSPLLNTLVKASWCPRRAVSGSSFRAFMSWRNILRFMYTSVKICPGLRRKISKHRSRQFNLDFIVLVF